MTSVPALVPKTKSPFAPTVEEAAVGKPSCRYYVAVIKAIKIRGEGMEILPDPLPDKPGHARIPQLNWKDSKDPKSKAACKNWITSLTRNLWDRIEGPFPREPNT